MKLITARAFNQDVTAAKRFAAVEPVFVTDRGRPTHVLLSIAAYRRLAGEEEGVIDLLAAAPGASAFDPADLAAAMAVGGLAMFLIDAPMVVSLRDARRGGSPGLAAWAGRTPRHRLFLSAVSLMTLYRAGAIAEARSRAEGEAWREWLDGPVSEAFDGRILPVDPAVVRRRARVALSDDRDALIAATALEHGLTLVTGRMAAFRGLRLKLLDPERTETEVEEGDWQTAARGGSRWLKTLFVRG